MQKPKHILVIRFSALGDVAMLVSVLNIFQKKYPEVKLTILTKSFFKPLFRDLEATIYAPDFKNEHKGILGLYKLAKQIKSLKIDAVADVHNVLRTKILKLFLFGTKFKQIDKGRKEKKALTNQKLFKQLKTTHQRYADVFEALGYPIDLNNNIALEPKKLSKSSQILTGQSTLPWVGIAPFAAFKGKMYPLDLMEKVIESLSKNNQVFLFGGGKTEVNVLNNIASKYANTINIAGQTNLGDQLDVISNLDVMLAMDSGNAHLAAMLGIKVVTIWGITHPYAGFYPFKQPMEFALLPSKKDYPLLPTSIYGNKCPENYLDVASTITPTRVISKVLEAIQKKPY